MNQSKSSGMHQSVRDALAAYKTKNSNRHQDSSHNSTRHSKSRFLRQVQAKSTNELQPVKLMKKALNQMVTNRSRTPGRANNLLGPR